MLDIINVRQNVNEVTCFLQHLDVEGQEAKLSQTLRSCLMLNLQKLLGKYQIKEMSLTLAAAEFLTQYWPF